MPQVTDGQWTDLKSACLIYPISTLQLFVLQHSYSSSLFPNLPRSIHVLAKFTVFLRLLNHFIFSYLEYLCFWICTNKSHLRPFFFQFFRNFMWQFWCKWPIYIYGYAIWYMSILWLCKYANAKMFTQMFLQNRIY